MVDQLVRNGFESRLDEPTRRALFDLRRRIDAVDGGTDSGVTGEAARWNSAWGVVGYAQVVANQTGISANVDVTGLTVTFTPVVGRRYRASVSMLLQQSSTAGVIYAQITNGAGTRVQWRSAAPGASNYFPLELDLVETFTSTAAVTRKVTLMTTAGTVSLQASGPYPAFISVEDVGPVTFSATPPPVDPTPAWTDLTFGAGWANYGGGYQTCQYRKVGDLVGLRGLAIAGAGFTTMVATLPAGFRPPAPVVIAVLGLNMPSGTDIWTWIDILLNGNIVAMSGANLAVTSWVTLSNVGFSVTA